MQSRLLGGGKGWQNMDCRCPFLYIDFISSCEGNKDEWEISTISLTKHVMVRLKLGIKFVGYNDFSTNFFLHSRLINSNKPSLWES